jgi:hypothetical protein
VPTEIEKFTLVSGRASTRAKDWPMRVRCCSLILTAALTCVPEDWAVLVCVFGCWAVAPEFGVAGFCREVVVEGAVCACDEPVEVDGVCDEEVVELGVVVDWLVDVPVAVEFCTAVPCAGVEVVDVVEPDWVWADGVVVEVTGAVDGD